MKANYNSFETLCVHGGDEDNQHQSVQPPLYLTSAFTFKDIQQADDTFSFKRKAYVYTRGGNPTVNLLERRMALLESAVGSVAFSSGMSAVTTVLLSFLSYGDTVIAHRNLYGSTFSAIDKLFPKYGIKANLIDLTDTASFEKLIDKTVKVVYFETPTNPSLEIIDIKAIASIAKKYGIKVVVDNTFATPYLQKPLTLGADVVVHSTTKYLNGHGDVVGGIACANSEEYLASLKFEYMCELGGVMSPFDAWLILRGLKTLPLRVEKHQQNTREIAEFLNRHPMIERVLYPGFENHPGHKIATEQMSGYGGIVSFELKGDSDVGRKFIESVKMMKIAVSLGDTETLIQVPALMTHRGYPRGELAKFGFSENTVRIAAGLENTKDLIDDINQALESIF
ncbi:PLP-dependent transferase [Allofrancisella guangzhouensis]|uniref:Methionine gamma-lyase n=1 Tax=Allofrancisella guangzhouensis TaxID=594679 RepID=A0A0A8E5P7_9GAMM|nr:PLP-dependent aspartate aminotransferase family protein [Allofrancisella guangzhouensis]AJC49289.1 methionine gamma-lyase [Allofrancisella guangzhouensis]MBK2027186.1 PLP-dependent transferase [Allofrancisella guangzhouensis]MBK2044622.1 PLP-dependent transferase [Allofrancisella guangzhouensis]MBK2045095.1 PLP-dependent transferase [Allofrancisella guangzhouensis]